MFGEMLGIVHRRKLVKKMFEEMQRRMLDGGVRECEYEAELA